MPGHDRPLRDGPSPGLVMTRPRQSGLPSAVSQLFLELFCRPRGSKASSQDMLLGRAGLPPGQVGKEPAHTRVPGWRLLAPCWATEGIMYGHCLAAVSPVKTRLPGHVPSREATVLGLLTVPSPSASS